MTKILTVFTGGTIGSSRANGAISPDGKKARCCLTFIKKNTAWRSLTPSRPTPFSAKI